MLQKALTEVRVGVDVKRVRKVEFLYDRRGTYYFRRAVPADARDRFEGRREVVASLGTSDLSEARHRLAARLGDFDRCLAMARGVRDPTALPPRRRPEPSREDVERAARTWMKERLSREHVDYFDRDVEGAQRHGDLETYAEVVAARLKPGGGGADLTTRWVAEHIREANSWTFELDSPIGRHLLRWVSFAQAEFARRAADEIDGKPLRVHDDRFLEAAFAEDRRRSARELEPVSLLSLFERYVAERRPRPATVKAWSRHVRAFCAFVGHDDATRFLPEDVVAWKDHLLGTPGSVTRSARTVNDTYLPGLRVAFGWGIENRKVIFDPTRGVRVRVPRKVENRGKSLTDEEARLILKACLAPAPPRMSEASKRARRWVPWLCAYTGARVNEMTQLRAEDVVQLGDIWAVRITPEAGSTKTGMPRTVPLHAHLVEQGFVEMARKCSGPLFYEPQRHRGGGDGNPQYKKVGERLAAWVRSIGVNDPHVAPNHGWRHRFKDRAWACRMDPESRDTIQGHAPSTEGRRYGKGGPPLSVLAEEMMRYPREVG